MSVADQLSTKAPILREVLEQKPPPVRRKPKEKLGLPYLHPSPTPFWQSSPSKEQMPRLSKEQINKQPNSSWWHPCPRCGAQFFEHLLLSEPSQFRLRKVPEIVAMCASDKVSQNTLWHLTLKGFVVITHSAAAQLNFKIAPYEKYFNDATVQTLLADEVANYPQNKQSEFVEKEDIVKTRVNTLLTNIYSKHGDVKQSNVFDNNLDIKQPEKVSITRTENQGNYSKADDKINVKKEPVSESDIDVSATARSNFIRPRHELKVVVKQEAKLGKHWVNTQFTKIDSKPCDVQPKTDFIQNRNDSIVVVNQDLRSESPGNDISLSPTENQDNSTAVIRNINDSMIVVKQELEDTGSSLEYGGDIDTDQMEALSANNLMNNAVEQCFNLLEKFQTKGSVGLSEDIDKSNLLQEIEKFGFSFDFNNKQHIAIVNAIHKSGILEHKADKQKDILEKVFIPMLREKLSDKSNVPTVDSSINCPGYRVTSIPQNKLEPTPDYDSNSEDHQNESTLGDQLSYTNIRNLLSSDSKVTEEVSPDVDNNPKSHPVLRNLLHGPLKTFTTATNTRSELLQKEEALDNLNFYEKYQVFADSMRGNFPSPDEIIDLSSDEEIDIKQEPEFVKEEGDFVTNDTENYPFESEDQPTHPVLRNLLGMKRNLIPASYPFAQNETVSAQSKIPVDEARFKNPYLSFDNEQNIASDFSVPSHDDSSFQDNDIYDFERGVTTKAEVTVLDDRISDNSLYHRDDDRFHGYFRKCVDTHSNKIFLEANEAKLIPGEASLDPNINVLTEDISDSPDNPDLIDYDEEANNHVYRTFQSGSQEGCIRFNEDSHHMNHERNINSRIKMEPVDYSEGFNYSDSNPHLVKSDRTLFRNDRDNNLTKNDTVQLNYNDVSRIKSERQIVKSEASDDPNCPPLNITYHRSPAEGHTLSRNDGDNSFTESDTVQQTNDDVLRMRSDRLSDSYGMGPSYSYLSSYSCGENSDFVAHERTLLQNAIASAQSGPSSSGQHVRKITRKPRKSHDVWRKRKADPVEVIHKNPVLGSILSSNASFESYKQDSQKRFKPNILQREYKTVQAPAVQAQPDGTWQPVILPPPEIEEPIGSQSSLFTCSNALLSAARQFQNESTSLKDPEEATEENPESDGNQQPVTAPVLRNLLVNFDERNSKSKHFNHRGRWFPVL